MTPRHEDDAPDYTADDTELKPTRDPAPVVPEAGEGPFSPLTGEPRPPIGN